MKEIVLAHQKGVALVDDDDYDRVSEHHWRLHNRGYAITTMDKKTVTLHRFVLNARPKSEVDHINHNKLDCRKENLRTCTSSQNKANSYVRNIPGRSSKYKGVSRAQRGKWYAHLCWQGHLFNVCGIETEEIAARAYDALAKEFFGEFARTNF